MNKRQKLVVLVGLALIVLMGLFPPWIHSFVFHVPNCTYRFERSAGYSLVFNPPEPGRGQNVQEFSDDMMTASLDGIWEAQKKAAEREAIRAKAAAGMWGPQEEAAEVKKMRKRAEMKVEMYRMFPRDEDVMDKDFLTNTVWTPRIDIVRLLIQWALIIFVISGIFIFLKDEKE